MIDEMKPPESLDQLVEECRDMVNNWPAQRVVDEISTVRQWVEWLIRSVETLQKRRQLTLTWSFSGGVGTCTVGDGISVAEVMESPRRDGWTFRMLLPSVLHPAIIYPTERDARDSANRAVEAWFERAARGRG